MDGISFSRRWILTWFFSLLCVHFLLAQSADTDTTNIMILLDGSGSMNERIQGRTKLDMAREVLDRVLPGLPASVRSGLRVYGHQSPRSAHDCQDTRLEVPLDFYNQWDIRSACHRIEAKGYTPLAYSLEQIQYDLPPSGENYIICITDGIETCGGDPCAVATQLRQSGYKVTIHVVGFRIGEADREILMCIPENSGGQYFAADDVGELKKALDSALEASIDPGFLQLRFKGLEHTENAVFARVRTSDEYPLFISVSTEHPIALAPGSYKLYGFGLYAIMDREPYCPDQIVIDSVQVFKDSLTIVELDEYAVLDCRINLPENIKTPESHFVFEKHLIKYVPDLKVESPPKWILLQQGEYDISCVAEINDKEKQIKKTIKAGPQSYQIIRYNFDKDYSYLKWLAVPLIIALVTLLSMPSRKKEKELLWQFSKNPDRFRGKKMTFSLNVDRKDLRVGHQVQFYCFYPFEVLINIMVPSNFHDIMAIDTSKKIRVTFLCNKGSLEKGNYMVGFRQARFYE